MEFRNWHSARARGRAALYRLASLNVSSSTGNYLNGEALGSVTLNLHANGKHANIEMSPAEAAVLAGNIRGKLDFLVGYGIGVPGYGEDEKPDTDDTWPAGSVGAFRKEIRWSWQKLADHCSVHIVTAQKWGARTPTEPSFQAKLALNELAIRYEIDVPVKGESIRTVKRTDA